MNLTQAQWHRIAAADDVIWQDGQIVGVIEDGKAFYFAKR